MKPTAIKRIRDLVYAGESINLYGPDEEVLKALRAELDNLRTDLPEDDELCLALVPVLKGAKEILDELESKQCLYYEGISYLIQFLELLDDTASHPEQVHLAAEKAQIIREVYLHEKQEDYQANQAEREYLDRVFKEITFLEFSTLDAENQELYEGFCEESRDLLESYEQRLLEVAEDPKSLDVHELFRTLHTIKGTASFMNLGSIQNVAHAAENLLGFIRENPGRMSLSVYQLLLNHLDLIKGLFDNLSQRIKQSADGKPRYPKVFMIGPMLASITQIIEGAEPEAESAQKREPAPSSSGSAAPKAEKDDSIRIPVQQLEEAYDLIGELTVLINSLREESFEGQSRGSALGRVARLTQVIADLRGLVAGMFMLPVSGIKTKLQRLCMDVARKTNKMVRFEMKGEDINLHKNTLEQLHNLLVHMLRNSIDHGIEPPEQRKQQGKSEQGVVRLQTALELDKLEFRVGDDGRGLDPEKIRAKAVKLGWINEGDNLPDDQLYSFILKPGFSLAEQVTDISGRGVGMDVVANTAHQLGGELKINNQPGKGLEYRILLPMTNSTSIINGLVGELAGHFFIFPIFAVSQTYSPSKGKEELIYRREGEFLRVREEILPVVRMDRILGLPDQEHHKESVFFLISFQEQMFAMRIDHLISQQQVVVEALDDQVRHLPGIDSCALLGNGRMGLIVDPRKIIERHLSEQNNWSSSSQLSAPEAL